MEEFPFSVGDTVMVVWGDNPDAELRFPAKVIDAKPRYGRFDVRVTPLGGAGERWVAAARGDGAGGWYYTGRIEKR